ncbi:hypothetical protein KM92DES2_12489 [uncultured Desulfovibrio sp.]|uniref:Uncharacterized protein n=1 Tax=uncultured Desulfovibrio sp. TaxID=167968 RepID=A0A212K9V0_9BACT|nr:hypothetical protein KM92DES2_12489 [uncultured Desulfovibrio sp.]
MRSLTAQQHRMLPYCNLTVYALMGSRQVRSAPLARTGSSTYVSPAPIVFFHVTFVFQILRF